MPKRVQLQRGTGWRMPPNTRKVDRSTVFGNPFDSVKYGVDDAVNLHRAWLTEAFTDEQIEARYPVSVAKHLIARRRRVLQPLFTSCAERTWRAGARPRKRVTRICCWS